MILILTNSLDTTTDLLIQSIGSQNVFRFNLDLYKQYNFCVDSQTFKISDPIGRTITEQTTTKLYIRKPTHNTELEGDGGSNEHYAREQLTYILQEIYNIMLEKNKVCLIEKGAELRIGKIIQMRLAEQFFSVPKWQIFFGHNSNINQLIQPTIIKTLKPTFTGDHKILFTKDVDPNLLDPQYPWFVQEKVIADYDVTVAVVNDKVFAYRLDRNSFDTPDWRKHIYSQKLTWEFFNLSSMQEKAVIGFMQAAKLKFGRLDFMMKDNQLFFLEVNPNGQWAWLDIEQNTGLFEAVVQELIK